CRSSGSTVAGWMTAGPARPPASSPAPTRHTFTRPSRAPRVGSIPRGEPGIPAQRMGAGRRQLFAVKPVEVLLAEMAGEHRLRRVLGPVTLTALGVGAIIGAGIFVLSGLAARDYAGPGLTLSFVVAGVGCALAALCYAEF